MVMVFPKAEKEKHIFLYLKIFLTIFNLIFFRYNKLYEDCEVIDVPSKFNIVQYAYALQKDSPYLPIFNYYLKLLDQQGTFHKLKKKYQLLPQNCQGTGGRAIGFESTLTAFLAFILGLILGMALLLMERLYILIPWRSNSTDKILKSTIIT